MQTTNIQTIEKHAQLLISQWLPKSWQFRWDRAKTRLGLCDYHGKWIQLSKTLLPFQSDEQITDVILHEIAHALAGPKAGHGPEWKKQAVRVGAKPVRCSQLDTDKQKLGARYVLKDQQGTIYKYYYRKPTQTMQHIERYWIRGLKSQTYGQLLVEKL